MFGAFDWGGVFIVYKGLYRAVADLLNVDYEKIKSSVFVEKYDLGMPTNEWLEMVKKENGIDMDTNELGDRLFELVLDVLKLDEEMFAMFNEIKHKFDRVVALSNINPMSVQAIRKKFPGFYFSFWLHFFSYEMGLAKPDPRIYREACRGLGAAPTSVIFVDDRVENVQAAQSIYMPAFLYEMDKENAVEKLKIQLLGILK